MATSDSYGQSKVLVREQPASGPVTSAELAASGGTVTVKAGGTLAVSGQITMQQGSTMTIAGGVNIASGNITMPGSLARGYIDLGPHLFGARVAASGETVASGSTTPTAFFGGLLMPDGAPALKMDSTANRRLSLNYASAIVAALALPPIAMPADFSTAGGLTLEMYGETVGTASAADAIQAFTWEARFSALTSASTPADAGTTAPSFTSTPSWKGITIASGSVATNQLSVIITPQAHALRAINIFGMRASYAKLTS